MKRVNQWILRLLLTTILLPAALPQLAFASTETTNFIAHRGYSQTAPENTLAAFQLAKEHGFTYVECDVAFTADGIAVLLHDDTIDRTSNGSGKVAELTCEQLLSYDFGSWKSSDYTGTKIPTFEEFISLCAELELHPYIELKTSVAYTQDKVQQLTEIVDAYRLTEHTTWISFSRTLLHFVKNVEPSARLGYLCSSDVTDYAIYMAKTLQTEENEVFLNLPYQELTEEGILQSIIHGISIEVYTVTSEPSLVELPSYVSGVTGDFLPLQLP